MKLAVIGCSHRTAALGLREQLSFDAEACRAVLVRFRREYAESEAVLLSTCNRTELYVARALHGHPRADEALRWLADARGIAPGALEGQTYQFADADAARHLFRVVCGLDSMVLGESQIVQQVRCALALARSAETCGPALGTLFERSFAVARGVRGSTGIGRGRFSLGGVAVELAARTFPRLDDKTVLMVGAGKIGEVTLRHFLSRGPGRVWLTSRNAGRAGRVAARLGAEVRPFERVVESVADSDVVVSCVSAPAPVLTSGQLGAVAVRRRRRPLLLVDLGVPRSIDPEAGGCEGVQLYNVDDLRETAESDRRRRAAALAEAERRVDAHLRSYLSERARREAGPIVAALRGRLEAIAEIEYAWLLPKLASGERPDSALIQRFVNRLIGKVLHTPSAALQRLSEEGKTEAYADMLRKVFELEQGES